MRASGARTLVAIVVLAASAGDAAPAESRTALFRYDANATYTVLAAPGVPTDLQLGTDEKVVGLALGDTVQWVVEELPGHVFVKPLKAGLFTAGTLVTDRRTYQLGFRSQAAGAGWHQRVSWTYPDLVVLRGAADRVPADTASREAVSAAVPAPPVTLERLNFNYETLGEADFKPLQVFDDGRFTWLRLRAVQSLPALFVVADEGAQLANYTVRGEYLVVQRLFDEALLKLGTAEVRIVNGSSRNTRRQPVRSLPWKSVR